MLGLYLALIDDESDKIKFVALYEEYRRLMLYTANEILKDTHRSEDAVQEAFIRIAKNFHKIDEIKCPRTRAFVVIITRNVAINMFNKERRNHDIFEKVAANTDLVSEEAFDNISFTKLSECMLELPEIYRDVLYLHHMYGYSFSETANLLSISVETAKKRAQRARTMLKQLVEGGVEVEG